jgi:hypothetical protein
MEEERDGGIKGEGERDRWKVEGRERERTI